jgi:hypothetical protein
MYQQTLIPFTSRFIGARVVLLSAFVLLALGLAGCEELSAPDLSQEAALDETVAPIDGAGSSALIHEQVSLRLGDGVTLHNGTRLVFTAVGRDSRCPTGVECVHAGQVTARFRLSTGDEVTSFILTLPGGNSDALPFDVSPWASAHGLAVYLVRLTPYPAMNEDTERSGPDRASAGQQATLVVRPCPGTVESCSDGTVDS